MTGSGFSVQLARRSPLASSATTRFLVPHAVVGLGKSSRVWPPRDSVRSSAAFAMHSETMQHVAQVDGEVPARVVLPVALHAAAGPAP